MVERNLWEAGFALDTSRKSAGRGDVLHVSGGLFRCAACLVQVVFALNETYCINEKGALKLASTFSILPPEFAATITDVLGHLGNDAEALKASIERLAILVEKVRELAAL